MKRLLLNLTACFLTASSVFAQTNSDDSGNKPTATNNGYTFEFNTALATQGDNENANCVGTHVPTFSGAGYTVDMSGDAGSLKIAGGAGRGYWTHFKFTSGNCVANPISFPGTGDVTIKFRAKASATVNLFVELNSTAGTPAALVITDINSPVSLSTSYAEYTVTVPNSEFTTDVPRSNVEGISFHISDEATAYDVQIDYIKIGDANVVSGTNNSIVDNTLINVFPNPAKDEVNIDLARLNGQSANVKVINMYGEVVKEEVATSSSHKVSVADLEKGMYMIQVSADNKVSNKKVVVE